MSTPASKIASDWSSSVSTNSKQRAAIVTPMPSTPYGKNQFVVFIYYFCTIILGLGFCKRYSSSTPSSTPSTPSTPAGSTKL
ncbi:hypothetical protein BGX23_011538 [Mortierella sp. AD031]|nr:hypothetical protein BGX23_011538 [Mortierella sp. AD031]KAG0216298.1 hypothetical protein BGX33_000259 [Mortierella sp. NVP41]